MGWLILGFAPGLFWLWFYRRKDDLEPEPAVLLLFVFALGCLSVVPIWFLRPLYEVALPQRNEAYQDLFDCLILTAVPEELVKLLALLIGAWYWSEFDEPLDGIIYGIAAGLGFASVENVLFLRVTHDPSVALARGFTATLAHAAFSGSVGFFCGLAKFDRRRTRGACLVGAGFVLATVQHGFYDYFLIHGRGNSFVSLTLLLPLALLLVGLKIRWARARSPLYHPNLTDSSRHQSRREAARQLFRRKRQADSHRRSRRPGDRRSKPAARG